MQLNTLKLDVYIWIGVIGVVQQGGMDAVLCVAIAWLCT